MIVLEGPDGSGKTTLLERLKKQLPEHAMAPRPCSSDRGVNPDSLRYWVVDDASRPVHHRTIYDRHPLISEPIYGPLVRGRMASGFDDVDWMYSQLLIFREKHPLIIFCLPPLEAVKHNLAESHGTHTSHLRGVHAHVEAIWSMYRFRCAQEMAQLNAPVWVWDYTAPGNDKEFDDLMDLIEEERA